MKCVSNDTRHKSDLLASSVFTHTVCTVCKLNEYCTSNMQKVTHFKFFYNDLFTGRHVSSYRAASRSLFFSYLAAGRFWNQCCSSGYLCFSPLWLLFYLWVTLMHYRHCGHRSPYPVITCTKAMMPHWSVLRFTCCRSCIIRSADVVSD